MERQTQGFRQVAQQYELEARDVCGVEVAETKSRISATYQSALNQATGDLNRQQSYVQNLSKDLVAAQSVANAEAANARASSKGAQAEVQICKDEVMVQAQQLIEIEQSKLNQARAEFASQIQELNQNLIKKDSEAQCLLTKFHESQHELQQSAQHNCERSSQIHDGREEIQALKVQYAQDTHRYALMQEEYQHKLQIAEEKARKAEYFASQPQAPVSFSQDQAGSDASQDRLDIENKYKSMGILVEEMRNTVSQKDMENEQLFAKIDGLENEIEQMQDMYTSMKDKLTSSSSSKKEGNSSTQCFDIGSPPPKEINANEAQDPLSSSTKYFSPQRKGEYHVEDFKKQVDERIEIEPLPPVYRFRAWWMDFKKTIASASSKSNEAFTWIGQVEKVQSIEELEDSAGFDQLDVKMGRELCKIVAGEFKRTVQVKEQEYSNKGKC